MPRLHRLTRTFLCAGCLCPRLDPPAYVVGPAALADVAGPAPRVFGRPCTRIGPAVLCGPGGTLSALEQTRFGALADFPVFTPLLRFCTGPCLTDWIAATRAGHRPSRHPRS